MNIIAFIFTLSLCLTANAYFVKVFSDVNCTAPSQLLEYPIPADGTTCSKDPNFNGFYLKLNCTSNQMIKKIV